MTRDIIDFGQNPYALIPVETLRQAVGWKEAAYRTARRDGLKTIPLGNRRFVLVSDWQDYIDRKAAICEQ